MTNSPLLSERNLFLQEKLGIDPFEAYEREVMDCLIDVLEISNGDAQGICETNRAQSAIRAAFMTGQSANQCANTIANQ